MRHRIPVWALPLVLLLPAAAAGETPKLSASASKTDVGVGELFVVEVKAEAPLGTSWTFAAEAGDEKVELWVKPAQLGSSADAPGTQRYHAMALALSDVAVPAIKARYRTAGGSEGEVATEPLPLRVVSVLPKDPKEQALADIRGPVPLTVGTAFWAAAAGLLALLAALVFWLVRRRRAALRPATAVPDVAPDVQALLALEALLASGRLARGELRPFYIELSEIAKRYLERRLEAPVLEMTSAEMAAFLRDHVHGHTLAPAMRELLGAADLVKFACGTGRAQEAERLAAAVRALIAALELRLRPQPADAQKVA